MKLPSKIIVILWLSVGLAFANLVFIHLAFAQSVSVSLEPLDYGMENTVVSVGTTAVALPATALSGRKSIIVKNVSSGVVYLGKSDVTADTTTGTGGFQLAQNATFQGDLGENVILYGIVASGTSNVCVIEVK